MVGTPLPGLAHPTRVTKVGGALEAGGREAWQYLVRVLQAQLAWFLLGVSIHHPMAR